jgi:mono/diheme cytochrome c family protein
MTGGTQNTPGRWALVLTAVAVGAVGLVVAFYRPGAIPETDVEAGRTLFVGSCGGCHTLMDAGTESPIAPNLDDSFRAARQAGMDEAQFHGVVRRWITISQPPMPRDIVTGQDAENVAAYVARVAGTSPESTVRRAAPLPPEAPDPPRQEQN